VFGYVYVFQSHVRHVAGLLRVVMLVGVFLFFTYFGVTLDVSSSQHLRLADLFEDDVDVPSYARSIDDAVTTSHLSFDQQEQ
jgi:hypothetical protein